MIASTPSVAPVSATPTLQNSLTADAQLFQKTDVARAVIPQIALNEFALRFNASMIEMLNAEDVSPASPLSKKLRAYATAGVRPARTASRLV